MTSYQKLKKRLEEAETKLREREADIRALVLRPNSNRALNTKIRTRIRQKMDNQLLYGEGINPKKPNKPSGFFNQPLQE